MERQKDSIFEREADGNEYEMPKKANDIMRDATMRKPAPQLFGSFWQKGEVALLFGATGVGKSVLAVQIADALARGTPIDTFEMPKRRHKVLYVDLTLSESQFYRRYTQDLGQSNAKPYKFAERFYRGCPRHDEDLCKWVRFMIRRGGFEAVVIDDLSAVMRTEDGTFDSLRIMRDLKRLSQETGVSVLVLADSYPSRKACCQIYESDLRRSRVLCNAADSVFAIGRLVRGDMRLIQFRSQGSAIVWGSCNPIGCMIRRRPNGLLGFVFDKRFARKLDPQRCRLIHFASLCRANGFTYRNIATVMGISKSHAERLVKAWTPAITDEVDRLERLEFGEDGKQYDDQFEDDKHEQAAEGDAADQTPERIADVKNEFWYQRIDPRKLPFASGIRPRHIHDLERGFDHNDAPIFIETRYEHSGGLTGKLKVWYKVNPRTGMVTRMVKGLYGNSGDNIGKTGWI